MHPNRREELIAILSGASMTLAFAPLYLFPVSVIAVAILFALWLSTSTRRAAWLGLLFGVAMFASGVSWVFVSMHNFGNMVSPLAAFTTVLFAALMALYVALAGALQSRFRQLGEPFRLLLVMPFLWTTFEWLRGWLFTGFSWLNLGDSQSITPLAGFAPLMGVYFMTLAVAVSAGLLVVWFRRGGRNGWRFGAALAAIWLAGWLAGAVQWVEPTGGAHSGQRTAGDQMGPPLSRVHPGALSGSEPWRSRCRSGCLA
jgi:apolipoprotein N-acyltransferase